MGAAKLETALRALVVIGFTMAGTSGTRAQQAESGALPDAAQAGSVISLTMDYSTIMKLPPNVATLIVGNPMIADATVNRTGLMVLTGKGHGDTNLIGLDINGRRVFETIMAVRPRNTNMVQVYRGPNARNSYTCAPTCNPAVAIGDDSMFYGSTIEQTMMRAEAANGQYVSSKSSEGPSVMRPGTLESR